MQPKHLSALREQAAAQALEPFKEALGGPILLRRERLDGDLHFQDPSLAAMPAQRKGNTLLHVPRLLARERLTGPQPDGRTPLGQAEVWVLDASAPVTLGRDRACDVVFRDHSVSAQHARLHRVVDTDWVFVVDLGSRNGTALNQRRLTQGERGELVTGDEVCFGREVAVFLSSGDLYRYLTGTL